MLLKEVAILVACNFIAFLISSHEIGQSNSGKVDVLCEVIQEFSHSRFNFNFYSQILDG